MERLTEHDEYGNTDIIGVDSANFQLNLEFKEFNLVTDALNKLSAYEDTGLTPEEIEDIKTIEEITELERKYLNDEHEYCGEYGTDECQFAYRIDKLQQECDFWEREAKKNCSKLGEQRIKLQQMECEMCKFEDTERCRQC